MTSFAEIPIQSLDLRPFSVVGNEKMLLCAIKRDGSFNLMTVGWGGFGVMWGSPCVFYAVRPERHTFSFVEDGEKISLSVLETKYAPILSYCGTHSGRDEDKLKGSGLHPIRLFNGQIGYEEARLIITAKKCYSAPLVKEGFTENEYNERWYGERGEYHTLYFSVIEKIYRRN